MSDSTGQDAAKASVDESDVGYLGFDPSTADHVFYYDQSENQHRAKVIGIGATDVGEPLLSVEYVERGNKTVVQNVPPKYAVGGQVIFPRRSWEPVDGFPAVNDAIDTAYAESNDEPATEHADIAPELSKALEDAVANRLGAEASDGDGEQFYDPNDSGTDGTPV